MAGYVQEKQGREKRADKKTAVTITISAIDTRRRELSEPGLVWSDRSAETT